MTGEIASPERASWRFRRGDRQPGAGFVRQIIKGGYDGQYAGDGLFALLDAYEERVASAMRVRSGRLCS